MNYEEELDRAYHLMSEYIDVNREHFDTLERHRLENKEKLNGILGLNAENNYRVILESKMTETQFRNAYPETTKFVVKMLKLLSPEDELKFIITDNKIITGKTTFAKLSKKIQPIIERLSDYGITNDYCTSCNELGIGTYTGNYVSNLLDMVKPKTIVLSTNLYDILTSSTNSSFSSCYRMDGGEYFNGNLSYARDSFTAIMFTYSDDIYRKIGRSWAYIFPEQFKFVIPEKAYGSIYKAEKKLVRKYIEHRISEYMGVRPYWKYITNQCYDDRNFSLGRGPVYFDYDRVGIAYHKRKTDDSMPRIDFVEALCMQCGDTTDHSEGGACEDCFEERNYCECCESYFRGETYSDNNGNTICESCYDEYCTECRYCGETIHNEDSHYVEDYGNVCDYCCSDHFAWCDDCETYHRNEDMVEIKELDRWVCNSCISDYNLCDRCGEHFADSLTEHTEGMLCDSCLDKVLEEEALEEANVELAIST